MVYFAEILTEVGIKAFVLSPDQLTLDPTTNILSHESVEIDLVYNRMTDFRFEEPTHKHIRDATIAKTVAMTPHPAGITPHPAPSSTLLAFLPLICFPPLPYTPHLDPPFASYASAFCPLSFCIGVITFISIKSL